MKIPLFTATEPIPSSIPVVPQGGQEAPWNAAVEAGHGLQALVIDYTNEMAKTRTLLKSADDALTINKKVNEFNDWHEKTSQILTESPNIDQTRRGEVFAKMSDEKLKEMMQDISPDDPFLSKKTQLALQQRIAVAGLHEGQIGFEKKREKLDADYDQLALDAANKGNISEVARIGDEAVKFNVWTNNKRNTTVNKYTEIAKKEAERLENKMVETKADLALTAKYGKNYDKIIDDLEDPEKYSKLGLTAERSANLISIVSNRKVKEEKERKAVWDGTRRQFAILDTQDSLSKEHVREALELNSVDPIVAEGYNRRIEEKIKGEGKLNTDPVVFSNLLSLAYTHPDKEYVKRQILSQVDRLEESDIEKLLNRNEEKTHSIENKRISRGIDLIKNTVIPKRGMTSAFLSTPKEEIDLADALKAFDNKVAEAQKGGKGLSAEDIDNYAREAAQSFTKTMPERMKKFNEYMVGQMKKDAGMGKEKFEIGKVYTDAKDRKAKYLGKGKWELQP